MFCVSEFGIWITFTENKCPYGRNKNKNNNFHDVLFYENLNSCNLSFQNFISNQLFNFQNLIRSGENTAKLLVYSKFLAYILIDVTKTISWNEVQKNKALMKTQLMLPDEVRTKMNTYRM